MPVNKYFQNYPGRVAATNEFKLMESIVAESIEVMGHNCYYVLRESFDEGDMVLGEYSNSFFKKAYTIEAYLENVEGFEGDDYFSKFGLDIKKNFNFIISRKSFLKIVPTSLRIRPQEGDLFYVPVLHSMFEIKFVEEEKLFYSLGKKLPYVYELRCEQFRATHEPIDTGNDMIDDIAEENSYAIQLNLSSGMGTFAHHEIVYQSPDGTLNNATAQGTVKDWYAANNNLYVFTVKGDFIPGEMIRGNDSGSIYTLQSVDDRSNFGYYGQYDNIQIEENATTFIDQSEKNPFGTP